MHAELMGAVHDYERDLLGHVFYRLTPPHFGGGEYVAVEVMPRGHAADPVGRHERIVMRWCDERGNNRRTYFHRIPHTQNPEDALAYLGYQLVEAEPYDPKVWKPVPLF